MGHVRIDDREIRSGREGKKIREFNWAEWPNADP
jgi:hypothetical protein